MPTGTYASHRYSMLKQINTSNASKLTPVWTFSTGELRGHQGEPLTIGNAVCLVTPLPNIAYAPDLNHECRISQT